MEIFKKNTSNSSFLCWNIYSVKHPWPGISQMSHDNFPPSRYTGLLVEYFFCRSVYNSLCKPLRMTPKLANKSKIPITSQESFFGDNPCYIMFRNLHVWCSKLKKQVCISINRNEPSPSIPYHNQPSSINDKFPHGWSLKPQNPRVFYKPGPLSTINSHGDGYLAGGAGDIVARIAAGAMIYGLGIKKATAFRGLMVI